MKIERKVFPITKDYLFSKIDSHQVFQYYVPNLKIQHTISSPIRKDNNPSWRVFPCGGVLLWKDFTTEETGDCVKMVQKMYPGTTYQQALEQIANDLGVKMGESAGIRVLSEHNRIECRPSLIQITARNQYTAADTAWWGQYLITPEDMDSNDIKSVSELYINRKRYPIGVNEKVYAYVYPENRFKIYMVEREKGNRWLSNISQRYIEGYSELNGQPKVLITKAKKDKILLQRLVPYPVLAVMNESGSGFTPEVIEKLKDKEVIINYDADLPGITNCKKLCDKHASYTWLNTPKYLIEEGIKDFSDWAKSRGNTKEIEEYLKRKGII